MNVENMDPSWIGSGSYEEEIYKENILDHYRNPRNFGRLEECTFCARDTNPLCGDNFELYVEMRNGKVENVKFHGNGCAISTAATSMLTDKIKGMTLEDLRKINGNEVISMIGITLGVVRMKCGLLCLGALNKGLKELEVLEDE